MLEKSVERRVLEKSVGKECWKTSVSHAQVKRSGNTSRRQGVAKGVKG